MKIFVQTASIDEIRRMTEAGLIDGVSLPIDELPDTEAVVDRLTEIEREFALPVCVPVPAFDPADIYREARDVGRISDHVIAQVPFLEDAIIPIRKLVADGIRVCATYVYTGTQAFLAAKVGARMIIVNVNDVDGNGQRGAQVVADIRDVIDQTKIECDLVVAGVHNAQQFTEAMLAGADIICVTPEFLHELLVHSLTDRGVDRFLRDVSRRRKLRGG